MNSSTRQKILTSLRAADSVQALYENGYEFAKALGFERFIYAVRVPVTFSQPYVFALNGFPSGWLEAHQELGYLENDPVVAHISKTFKPFFWDELTQRVGLDDEFFEHAKSYNLNSGLSMPIRGDKGEIAVMNVATSKLIDDDELYRDELMVAMQWYLPRLHERVHELVLDQPQSGFDVNLTKREQSCLRWVGDGKTSWEIGKILNISERTVVFHLKNATTKLQASNRQEAFAKALRFGKIDTFSGLDEHANVVMHTEAGSQPIIVGDGTIPDAASNEC